MLNFSVPAICIFLNLLLDLSKQIAELSSVNEFSIFILLGSLQIIEIDNNTFVTFIF